MLAGLFFRILAVVFSKGFGWIDDQFLIIEIAQSWVDGVDYYGWLPDEEGINKPKGFSFFYVGLHYLLFRFLEFVQITDAQSFPKKFGYLLNKYLMSLNAVRKETGRYFKDRFQAKEWALNKVCIHMT